MKALVFVDHDIICRHFIMSGAFAPLMRKAALRFVFPDDGGKRMKRDPATLPLNAPFERVKIDGERQLTWRWMLFADQLKWRRGAHERSIRTLRWSSLGWKAATLLTLAGYPPFSFAFQKFVARRRAARPNDDLAALLDRERPDVIIHPSVLEGVFINDLVLEARRRDIPLVVVMNSWDNPSTKRAVVGKPDWLLVWGPQTRDHAQRFIGLDPERIVPFGAAQFDVFRSPPRIDRARFAAEHGVDPNSRLVLFAGSNAQTDEFGTLSALDGAIEDGRLGNVSIIYRPHPWGEGGRAGARLAKAPWRHVKIHASMREYVARLASGPVGITLPDYRDTHDILSMVDVVVSPLSTILLESMLHGKPIVVYAPRDASGSEFLANNLPMLHFEEFLNIPGVALAERIEALVDALVDVVDPMRGPERGTRLRDAAERLVTPFERPWGERFADFLEQRVLHARAANPSPGRERVA